MHIIKGIKAVDLGLVIGNTLVVGDFHIGYEEALNKRGILIPRFQFEDIVKRIKKILIKIKPKIIVINGDLKHEFGTISQTEWKQTLKLLELLRRYCSKIILVKGNHDTILEPIAREKGLEITDFYIVDDVYICHGHKIPKDIGQNVIIIGHEHPAITLKQGVRAEKYKCFLLGNFNKKKLIVMPSFNLVTEGTDILTEKVLSPFLKQDLSQFKVFIIGDKVYDFGRLQTFVGYIKKG